MFNLSFRTWVFIAVAASWLYVEYFRVAPNAIAVTSSGAYTIEELQPYDETVRILGTETYRFGRESDVSPVDLAVGWGQMAEPEIYRKFDISQRNRWYFWRSADMPIPQREVETHSANFHIVPATPEVAAQLKRIGRDDLIRLSGALIEAKAPDGWNWRSSLSREDTGEGACELLLLRRIDWIAH